MKLYEIMLRKVGLWKDPPPEVHENKIYNPIVAKVGQSVSIDTLDYRGLVFFAKEVRENQVKLGGSNNKFIDYVLQARPIDKPDLWVRLRIVPDQNPEDRLAYRAMVLTVYDDLAYSEDLHGVVKDDTGKFVVDGPDDSHDEYWRVNDVKSSYVADITSMSDEDNSGRVDADEVKQLSVEFWDYSRMTNMEGVEKEQFLFVEMNKDNGWFQIWRGDEINPERVSVY